MSIHLQSENEPLLNNGLNDPKNNVIISRRKLVAITQVAGLVAAIGAVTLLIVGFFNSSAWCLRWYPWTKIEVSGIKGLTDDDSVFDSAWFYIGTAGYCIQGPNPRCFQSDGPFYFDLEKALKQATSQDIKIPSQSLEMMRFFTEYDFKIPGQQVYTLSLLGIAGYALAVIVVGTAIMSVLKPAIIPRVSAHINYVAFSGAVLYFLAWAANLTAAVIATASYGRMDGTTLVGMDSNLRWDFYAATSNIGMHFAGVVLGLLGCIVYGASVYIGRFFPKRSSIQL